MNDSEKLISWLKYLDIEYLDTASCEELSVLNINDPADQVKIINIAIRDEFNSLNNISQLSMMRILDEVNDYPESATREVMSRVGMPFNETLIDYKSFFEMIRKQL